MYAAGKIPGGFFKREGRAGEKAILTARMVDRPIRPLWPKGYKNEVQIIVTTLSADQVQLARHPGDQRRLGGADAVAACRSWARSAPSASASIDGELVVNPTHARDSRSRTLDLIVCGTPEAITMVEAGAQEVSEDAPDRGARAGPRRDQAALPGADRPRRARPASPKWVDGAVTESLRNTPRRRAPVGDRGGRARPRLPAAADALAKAELPEISGRPRRRPTCCTASACSSPFQQLVGEARDAGRLRPGQGAVRRCHPRADRRRAGLEGAEVGQAPRAGRADRRTPSQLPFPSRGEPDEQGNAPLDPAARAAVLVGRGQDLQGDRPHQDRGRQAPARRPVGDRDPARRHPRSR